MEGYQIQIGGGVADFSFAYLSCKLLCQTALDKQVNGWIAFQF